MSDDPRGPDHGSAPLDLVKVDPAAMALECVRKAVKTVYQGAIDEAGTKVEVTTPDRTAYLAEVEELARKYRGDKQLRLSADRQPCLVCGDGTHVEWADQTKWLRMHLRCEPLRPALEGDPKDNVPYDIKVTPAVPASWVHISFTVGGVDG